AESVIRTLGPSGRRRETLLLTDGAKPSPRSLLGRYGALLEGENAVLVALPPAEVQNVVTDLRSTGDPSIFMFTEEVPQSSSAPSPVSALSIAEMAQKCSERRNPSPLFK